MNHSLLTEIGIIIKKLTGIKDISLFIKECHKKVGKLFYHKQYNADEIVKIMQSMGMSEGSVVCIHAGMKEFYNYVGTPQELICKIQDAITSQGTLMMPAFPDPKKREEDGFIFDAKTEPTKAGLLAETFRKMPNVKRSINLQHSVCAWGKHAEWLTKDHQNCQNCWDKNSPWYRMTRLDGLVFSFGLPSFYIGTFVHCVEALLYKTHPYWKQFFTVKKTYRYYNNKQEIMSYSCMEGDLERRSHEKNIIRYFNKQECQHKRISNLHIRMYQSKACLDKMLELGKKGITIFYVPSPKHFKF